MGKYSDCLWHRRCVFIVFVFVVVFVFGLHLKVQIGNLSREMGEAGASKVGEGVTASLVSHFFNQEFFISFLSSGQLFWAQTFLSDFRVFSALHFYRHIPLDLK